MGLMKDFDRRILQGGDDAIAAVGELWREREKAVFGIADAFRWIPVSKRLPESVDKVLVYWIPRDKDGTPSCCGCDGKGGLIEMASYYSHKDEDGNEDGYWDCQIQTPLFWMPIPPPWF